MIHKFSKCQSTTKLQVLDVLALLKKLVVQKLWTLQGVGWFDVVRVVPRFADPRIQSNFVEN